MTALAIYLSLVIGILSLIYYLISKLRYFRDLGILHVQPWPIVGNMGGFVLRRTAVPHLMERTYNLNPDAKYVGFYEFMNPVIMLRDPDLIKSVSVKYFDNFMNHRGFGDEESEPLFTTNLFTLRDEKWRKMRNLLTPAFTSNKMKSMFSLMSDCGKDFADFISDETQDGQIVNTKDAFARFTNDIIGTCGFGIAVNSMRDPSNEFYVLAKKAATLSSFKISCKFFLKRTFPDLSKFLGIKLFDDHVREFFENIVEATIKRRVAEGIHRPDMIQLMMETKGKGDEELTISQMTAQVFIFFLGGFDTTSNLMCTASHLLATHPEVQEKLYREVEEVLARNNGELTYDSLNSMEYLDAVINEASRLYAIIPFLDRQCSKAFELPPALPGANPVTVQPGMSIWFPAYPLHRDARYFPDPDKFLPERFLDKKNINPYTFIPFGIGPRMCIGKRFAQMEVKCVLVHLLAKCEFVASPKTHFPITLSKSSFGFFPEDGFWLQFKPRKGSSI